uniref:Uncharacterized protein n=1 Tax=Chromera velia CCMP2878 TaxID=1169474 RepID=A0A0G4G509_9ALVE|eukprot:Cvel_565.t1-p1 / transcript=Cvel_565.t1 / gene=Cvel_565 / organism=Chromera_velia_CCMP2878 / gene_product=hypothetical protein / transcript_product=hypothetical protein / location=Cvel_scaffold17:151898-152767(-) / protein_length=290 / sequence_SO=supercontig / SO=protein_coding / is_pseudo=false
MLELKGKKEKPGDFPLLEDQGVPVWMSQCEAKTNRNVHLMGKNADQIAKYEASEYWLAERENPACTKALDELAIKKASGDASLKTHGHFSWVKYHDAILKAIKKCLECVDAARKTAVSQVWMQQAVIPQKFEPFQEVSDHFSLLTKQASQVGALAEASVYIRVAAIRKSLPAFFQNHTAAAWSDDDYNNPDKWLAYCQQQAGKPQTNKFAAFSSGTTCSDSPRTLGAREFHAALFVGGSGFPPANRQQRGRGGNMRRGRGKGCNNGQSGAFHRGYQTVFRWYNINSRFGL